MRVTHQLACFTPCHQHHLGVGFQSHHTINHLGTYGLQSLRPIDVGFFIEPGFDFHHRRDFLAAQHCFSQQIHQSRITAGAVNGLFDRQHLGIVDGFF